jgi:hypothetical protein
VLLFGSGAAIAATITWALVHPKPGGESIPVVFRGKTQAVTSDGDGVAFHPHPRFRELFSAFPAFEVSGVNRTTAVRPEVCLAPGTGEQEVVFAVVNTPSLSLAWYECLTEGIDLGWAE